MTGPAGSDRPVYDYVVTGGRVEPSRNTLRPETLLIAAAGTSAVPAHPAAGGAGLRGAVRDGVLPPEAGRAQITLLAWCRRPLSVAEAAAHLGRPVSVVVVLASDLIDAGYLQVRSLTTGPSFTARPSTAILEQVLDGLRTL